jgi:hypothetical protein
MGNLPLSAIEHDPRYADTNSPDEIMMEQEDECCQHCGHPLPRKQPRLPGGITQELLELTRKNPALLTVAVMRLNKPAMTERELARNAKVPLTSVNRYLHEAAAAAPGLSNNLLYRCRKTKKTQNGGK